MYQDVITNSYKTEELFSQNKVPVFIVNNKNRITYINNAFRQLFGFKDTKILGHNVDLLDAVGENSRCLSSLFNSDINDSWSGELFLRKQNGTNVFVYISLSNINKTNEFLGFINDLSYYHNIKNEFQLNKVYLDELFSSSPEAVVLLDNQDRVTKINAEFTRMFGYTQDEACGKLINDLIVPKDFSKEAQGLSHQIINGNRISAESIRQRKDGSKINVSILGAPIKNTDGQIGVYGIYRNISARKKAEEDLRRAKESAEKAHREQRKINENLEKTMQLAKEMTIKAELASAAKSDFLANMSHEIRTPMNGIIGMTDLALNTDLTDEQREYMEIVKSSSKSLMTIINDILDYSKIEAGKMELEKIDFNLRKHLAETIKTVAVRAHQKSLELAYLVEDDVPEILEGDPSRLRQIIVNLIGNAIKFTSAGEIVLQVEKEWYKNETISLKFSVTDTGIGIPEEKQKNIFNPFTQADGSTTRKFGGTGLGLTICKQLSQLMGGEIWIESPGRLSDSEKGGPGSSFYFTAQFSVSKAQINPIPELNLDTVKDLPVLVVDDNATNRKLLNNMLTNLTMQVTESSSGPDALNVLEKAHSKNNPFKLLITDGHMPEMDGFELAEKIRSNSNFDDLTIMMLTSAGRRGDGSRCKELRISSYLMKPVASQDLISSVSLVFGLDKINDNQIPEQLITKHSLRERERQLKILLAEDNMVNQKLAIKLLENNGYIVEVANNGQEAVSMYKNGKYDLILMDIQMPVMDGYEATAAIRDIEKNNENHIPIIALTAHAMKGDREKCLEASMDGYVTKPIHVNELRKNINKFFN